MQTNIRIDTRLRWFKPAYARAWTAERVVKVLRGKAGDVDALEALRAFAYKVRDVPTAEQFIREYGPLVEPVGDAVSVSDMVKVQRAMVEVWKEWRALDVRTLKQWREVAADFGAKVLPANLLAARQEHVARLLGRVRLNTRLEFEGGGLVLRANDLQSAMWLAIAQRIALGDASILCRNAGCGNYVDRRLANNNSMRRVYCEEKRDACTKIVKRGLAKGDASVDRYPQLEGLTRKGFMEAVRKLKGDEVL